MSRSILRRVLPPGAAIAGLVLAISSPASGRDHPMPLACHLDHRSAADLVTIEARISGRPDASGTYLLEITKTDRAGSSDIRQGGAFMLGRDGTAQAGQATLSLLDGGQLSVRLVARARGEEAECRLDAGDLTRGGGPAGTRREPQ